MTNCKTKTKEIHDHKVRKTKGKQLIREFRVKLNSQPSKTKNN